MKISLLVIMAFLNFSNFVFAGDRVGNGGDSDEILVKSVMQSLYNFLSSPVSQSNFPEVRLDQLKTVINESKVQVVDDDLFDHQGKIRTAINQPEDMKIFFNRKLFTLIREDSKVLVPLVFHELLGLLGIEASGDYPISMRIIEASFKIYQDAVANTSDIYFLTGNALKSPIPFWKASVKAYYDGTFISGIVARPFLLVSDKVKMVIDQGEELFIIERREIPTGGANAKIISGLLINNNHKTLSFVRLSEKSKWEKMEVNEIVLDHSNLSVHFLDINHRIKYSNEFVNGSFSKLAFKSNGEFEAGWCYFEDCIFQFGANKNAVKYLESKPRGFKVTFIKDIFLPVVGRRSPMKILGSEGYKNGGYPETYLNEKLEVIWGYIKGYYLVNREKFDVHHVDLNSGPLLKISRFKYFSNPLFANVPILASLEGAAAFCKDQNSSDEPRVDSSNVEIKYFSGEKTFYDYAKLEFVTYNSSPVNVFKSLGCSDTAEIDINDIFETK